MSDQTERCIICNLDLNDHWLGSCPNVASDDQPRTWDGEPLYSRETVQEGLFSTDAFQQMPGQLAMSGDPAVDAFNAHVARWTTPEAATERAQDRAEYERRYEAMMARKRVEHERLMGEAWDGPHGFWENRERNL